MRLTREQALHLLEPVWWGLLISELRAEALIESAPFTGSGKDLRGLNELQAAADYIAAKGRLLDPSFLLQAFQPAKGDLLFFPNVLVSDDDKAAALAAWMERNPKAKEEAELRSAAQAQRRAELLHFFRQKISSKPEVAS
ncbi:MAG TPA: hypothetical protein VFF76_07275 [Holophagaceae bacterium]|nr:hypothetical protein [Holophagaceae bacterium]